MTHDEFRQALRGLGLTSVQFAALVNVHPVTLSQWGRRAPFPRWVSLLLTAWYELGGPPEMTVDG